MIEGKQLLSEVENWDLPSIWEFTEILDMKADMSAAFREASTPEKPGGN